MNPMVLTGAEVDRINRCGEWLSVDILRPERGGNPKLATAENGRVWLVPCPRGNYRAADIERMKELGIAYTLLEVIPLRRPELSAPPRFRVVGVTHCQAGDNFVYTPDSRFRDAFGAPCSVHDHIEGKT